MSEIDYRPQQSNILYWRNVANEGRGSQMTQCLHEACDYAAKLETENAALRAAAERWRFARDWLCVEDFDRMADEMRGHVPSEDESAKTDAACDRARALLSRRR